MMRNIVRLGRLSAYERIADWLLEMYERLGSAGLTRGNSFEMPLTQETLADALGLTTVHVNRTLQSLRLNGVLSVYARTVVLHDLASLEQLLDRRPCPAPLDG
jgi:CRP-like cAMP-binding protein